MALPSTGSISFADLNALHGYAAGNQISLNDQNVRAVKDYGTQGLAATQISLSEMRPATVNITYSGANIGTRVVSYYQAGYKFRNTTFNLTVNSGAVLYATFGTNFSQFWANGAQGNFRNGLGLVIAEGDQVNITNYGKILGSGGQGGSYYYGWGAYGSSGIEMEWMTGTAGGLAPGYGIGGNTTITINNYYGIIAGGGGGGTAGSYGGNTVGNVAAGGGGAGGGPGGKYVAATTSDTQSTTYPDAPYGNNNYWWANKACDAPGLTGTSATNDQGSAGCGGTVWGGTGGGSGTGGGTGGGGGHNTVSNEYGASGGSGTSAGGQAGSGGAGGGGGGWGAAGGGATMNTVFFSGQSGFQAGGGAGRATLLSYYGVNLVWQSGAGNTYGGIA